MLLNSEEILKANARFECTSRNVVYAMICNAVMVALNCTLVKQATRLETVSLVVD